MSNLPYGAPATTSAEELARQIKTEKMKKQAAASPYETQLRISGTKNQMQKQAAASPYETQLRISGTKNQMQKQAAASPYETQLRISGMKAQDQQGAYGAGLRSDRQAASTAERQSATGQRRASLARKDAKKPVTPYTTITQDIIDLNENKFSQNLGANADAAMLAFRQNFGNLQGKSGAYGSMLGRVITGNLRAADQAAAEFAADKLNMEYDDAIRMRDDLRYQFKTAIANGDGASANAASQKLAQLGFQAPSNVDYNDIVGPSPKEMDNRDLGQYWLDMGTTYDNPDFTAKGLNLMGESFYDSETGTYRPYTAQDIEDMAANADDPNAMYDEKYDEVQGYLGEGWNVEGDTATGPDGEPHDIGQYVRDLLAYENGVPGAKPPKPFWMGIEDEDWNAFLVDNGYIAPRESGISASDSEAYSAYSSNPQQSDPNNEGGLTTQEFAGWNEYRSKGGSLPDYLWRDLGGKTRKLNFYDLSADDQVIYNKYREAARKDGVAVLGVEDWILNQKPSSPDGAAPLQGNVMDWSDLGDGELYMKMVGNTPVGTVATFNDGKTYKRVATTGSTYDQWQEVDAQGNIKPRPSGPETVDDQGRVFQTDANTGESVYVRSLTMTDEEGKTYTVAEDGTKTYVDSAAFSDSSSYSGFTTDNVLSAKYAKSNEEAPLTDLASYLGDTTLGQHVWNRSMSPTEAMAQITPMVESGDVSADDISKIQTAILWIYYRSVLAEGDYNGRAFVDKDGNTWMLDAGTDRGESHNYTGGTLTGGSAGTVKTFPRGSAEEETFLKALIF